MNNWQAYFLQLLGIPVNAYNINWINNWAAAEEPNGGFGPQGGPNSYSYYANNPFNIKIGGQFATFATPQQGMLATVQWLQNNGGYGGTGTYAQEIKNFLTGLPNQLALAFSYYTDHGGNPGAMSASYQNLVSNQPSSSGQTQSSSGSGFTLPNPSDWQQQLWNAITNPGMAGPLSVGLAMGGQGGSLQQWWQNFAESGALLLGAITLVFVGGLWIILGNQDTKKIFVAKATDALT